MGRRLSIKKFVHSLIKKFGTNSPFELCQKLNINVLFVDLPDSVNGFFLNSKNKRFILIKKTLSPSQKQKICAHELAHALLHSNINSVVFEKENPDYIKELENQANSFSKILLDK